MNSKTMSYDNLLKFSYKPLNNNSMLKILFHYMINQGVSKLIIISDYSNLTDSI